MVARNAEADFGVGLKASTGCKEFYLWRLLGIRVREGDLPMVDAVFIGAVLQTKNDKVPVKDVVRFRCCHKVVQLFSFQQFDVFLLQSQGADFL